MPFELAHLAVGAHLNPHSIAFLAGNIYPDIRYLANIDRRLTHSLDPLHNCPDLDFVKGVKCHIDTDKVWDELVAKTTITHSDPHIPPPILIGILKLIHDRVSYRYLDKAIAGKLINYQLPANLPIKTQQWQLWVAAIRQYLADGPTHQGWINIVTTMNFQTKDQIEPRLAQVETLYPRLQPIFITLHQQLLTEITN